MDGQNGVDANPNMYNHNPAAIAMDTISPVMERGAGVARIAR